MKPEILYKKYHKTEIMQHELHIWLQMVAMLLPKPFPLISKCIWASPVAAWTCFPSPAVPGAALCEVGELRAAALPSPQQQLSSPPRPFVASVCDISAFCFHVVYVQRPPKGLWQRALPKAERLKLLKYNSRCMKKYNVARTRFRIGDNVCTHCFFCDAT